MKKLITLLAFAGITALFSTAGAAPPPDSGPAGNCATLCPACIAAGGICIHTGTQCFCE